MDEKQIKNSKDLYTGNSKVHCYSQIVTKRDCTNKRIRF